MQSYFTNKADNDKWSSALVIHGCEIPNDSLIIIQCTIVSVVGHFFLLKKRNSYLINCINLIAGFMRLAREKDNPNKKILIYIPYIPNFTKN